MYEEEMVLRADRFNDMMCTASSAPTYGGGGRRGKPLLSRTPTSFDNRVPEYIPDIDELTVDDPFYYPQDVDVQYGRQQHSRPGAGSFYEGEESDEDSRELDEDFAFSRQQARGPPRDVSSAVVEGVDGIVDAGDRFFSEPRRMMLHYRPR
ncbi:unnamed protein product [Schistocephalus solidus]|nr:unnamed protein product [Schistocephalus solidus]